MISTTNCNKNKKKNVLYYNNNNNNNNRYNVSYYSIDYIVTLLIYNFYPYY